MDRDKETYPLPMDPNKQVTHISILYETRMTYMRSMIHIIIKKVLYVMIAYHEESCRKKKHN